MMYSLVRIGEMPPVSGLQAVGDVYEATGLCIAVSDNGAVFHLVEQGRGPDRAAEHEAIGELIICCQCCGGVLEATTGSK